MGSVQRVDRPKPWLARYRAPDGRQYSRSFKRKVDAEKWLTMEESKALRGEWVDPSAGTVIFADWVDVWLSGLHGIEPKTRAGYESLLRSRVLPAFGGVELRRITTSAVREWIARMAADDLSAARIRQARQVLHAALDLAVSDGLISSNPCNGVKPPTVRRRRQLFLTADQLAALADAAERRHPGAGALVMLLGYGGLRWGEVVALDWANVNLEQRRVRVESSATEVNGRLEWGDTKTHETRTVVLPRFVAARLGPAKSGLVFTAPRGGPLRSSNFRRSVWIPACKNSGMPEGLMVHDLRDTAASLAISAGASIKAVQRMLGHASAAMTLDTYGSLFTEDLKDLADRMDAKYG